MLKKCSWKGKEMSCSAIFETFPTDRGMCCTFNMKKAEEIFRSTKYQQLIKKLQNRDANDSFTSSKLPEWFVNGTEPIPHSGVKKGLSLMLDAHTNLVSSSSVKEDFQGFIAVISPRDSYPLTLQNSIRIRPGHDNLVALTAVEIAASGIEGIPLDKRGCYFPQDDAALESVHLHKVTISLYFTIYSINT